MPAKTGCVSRMPNRACALPALMAVLLCAGPAMAAHGENCVGINTHLSSDDTYDAVAAMGVHWVRIDLNWMFIETSQGHFEWAEVDRVVNKATSLGLKIYATFAYTPAWASTGNVDGRSSNNDVPKSGLYEKALREAVKRYRATVKHWGLWNEPNLGGFWEGNAQQYTDLIVKPGADAVHQECPECFTLGPELANVGDQINTYYDTVLNQAGTKFDIIAHHTYQDFPEMDPGAGIFGDSFYNAIEKKRAFSTRMALFEALAKYNLTGRDVWITETGWQCKPPTDGVEMDKQKQYTELVLKAEEDRAWYTNTFFYEIEDCDYYANCDIGGYGIMRRTGGPDGTWQDNFMFKPAYAAIKDWIAAHPDWCKGGATDGGTPDTGHPDAGGDAGTPDAGSVAPTTLYAMRTPVPLAIDGKLDEWSFKYEAPVTSADYVALTAPTAGDSDLSGKVLAMWDDAYLYLAAIITDNVHVNTHTPDEMWLGDSWQIAIDADFDRTVGQFDTDGDSKVGFGVLAGGPASARWDAPGGAPGWNPKFMSGTDAQGRLVLEIAIPWSQLPPMAPAVGKMLGFSYLINDDDGSGRKGFIEWSSGIGIGKDPSKFGTLALTGGPCESDTSCKSAGDCAAAPATCQCGPGAWTCNGAKRCEWICGVEPDGGVQDTGVAADTGVLPDTGGAADAGTLADTSTGNDTGGTPGDTGSPNPADGGGLGDVGGKKTDSINEGATGCSCATLAI